MQIKTKLVSLPILFSHPPFKIMPPWLPYGPAVIVSFLRKHNCEAVLEDLYYEVQVYNAKCGFLSFKKISFDLLHDENRMLAYLFNKDDEVDDLFGRITNLVLNGDFNLIGFSVNDYIQFIFSLILTKKIKTQEDIVVVLGGAFITKYRDNIFKEFEFLHKINVDYMISGEGQVPLLKLIRYLEKKGSIDDVPNLIYKDNLSVRSNPYVYFPFDNVPVPDFSDLDLDFYNTSLERDRKKDLNLPYQVTRGCLYNCSFCGGRKTLSNTYEVKSYDKIISEITYMKNKYKSSSFWFRDDSINCSYDYLYELCSKFIENKLDINWGVNGVRPDNLDRKILRIMKKAGCYLLSFGIESGSNKVLRMMGKSFTIETAERALKDSHKEGLKNWVNMIVGYPYEREEDIVKTVDFIRNNAFCIDKVNFVSILQVRYGSALYEYPDRFGISILGNTRGSSHSMGTRHYPFDESHGLRWKQKQRQAQRYRKIIMYAEFKYILMKRYRLAAPFMFNLYSFFRNHYIFSDMRFVNLLSKVLQYLSRDNS